jgi:hypothetical protein
VVVVVRSVRARAAWWIALGLSLASFAAAAGVAGGAALTPPTSPLHGAWGWYDLLEVAWSGASGGEAGELRVTLAAVDVGGAGALGLRQPIVEVYLLGGAVTEALPGSGLRFPSDAGWSQAVRVNAEGAWRWGADGGVERLEASIDGSTVRIVWPLPLPSGARWIAISGVFDPFSPNGWRPFAAEPSPWTFSSPEIGPPVVDVLPGDAASWTRLRATGLLTLPGRGGASLLGRGVYLALMLLGLAVAIIGLVLRDRAGRVSGAARRGAARMVRGVRRE